MYPFPSLKIRAHSFEPVGSFAVAQAEFLEPEQTSVQLLDDLLHKANVGVVAHFYMDSEIQGVLGACRWPHIHVADSLKMADGALDMARRGVDAIAVLGVDFMSEYVRAVLDSAGFSIPVYRLATEAIGCSLAESAEQAGYEAWLRQAAATGPALHVIYVNTSLPTKALCSSIIPTMSCTSANVIRTVLQAFAQVPDLRLYYGPDTYMGANLAELFKSYVDLPPDEVSAIHPAHDPETIRALLDRFEYYEDGKCIVHHMFDSSVANTVREHYRDSLITAHLETPGEMFGIAVEAMKEGRGAIGSTANLLSFILDHVERSLQQESSAPIRVILGTEAGIATVIVREVQRRLREYELPLEVEVVFPVSDAAVAQVDDPGLGIIPGVAEGEGCSVSGGCAICPFMKQNDLDGLVQLLERIRASDEDLSPFEPRKYVEQISGSTIAELGAVPIRHMRAFQTSSRLPLELLSEIEAMTSVSAQ